MRYLFLADAVLVVHALYVIFILGGLIMILLGAGPGWQWVRNFRFRILHLAAIIVVALQSWMEIICPLTTLEMYFRQKAGQPAYRETFVAHWLHELLFYEAPFRVFNLAYTIFALAVFGAWLLIPPEIPWKKQAKG
jgi:hypothetical protein